MRSKLTKIWEARNFDTWELGVNSFCENDIILNVLILNIYIKTSIFHLRPITQKTKLVFHVISRINHMLSLSNYI